jgi:hypothetical protein
MSKIRKINLIKKNWILNGIWLLEIGSNPHSNGEVFSRSWNDFLDIKKFKINKIKEIKRKKKIKINIWIIIYIKMN